MAVAALSLMGLPVSLTGSPLLWISNTPPDLSAIGSAGCFACDRVDLPRVITDIPAAAGCRWSSDADLVRGPARTRAGTPDTLPLTLGAAGPNGLLSMVCTYSSIDVSLLCSSSHACGGVSMGEHAVSCGLSLGHPNTPSGACSAAIDASLDDDLVTGLCCAVRVVISVTSLCAPVDNGMVC